MASMFEIVINRLREIGAFQFLFPFVLTSAVFYGLLRKTKLFGEAEKNVAVNGVIALIAAFMVWAYPILAGVNVEVQLATFFFQGTTAMLVFVAILLIAGMFLPEDLPKAIGAKMGGRGLGLIIIAIAIIGFGIFISSGLITFFFPTGLPTGGIASEDLIMVITVLIILLLPVLVIIFPGREGSKEEKKA